MEKYDSTKDTLEHIKNIRDVFTVLVIPEIEKRVFNHDLSKLSSPEKETYDKYIPELKKVKYGSEGYKEVKTKMYEEGLKHHFESNRHHPEHFKNGVDDMDLFDIIEMFSDWFAASLKSDTPFIEGLDTNIKNNKINPQLAKIFKNTYNTYFKPFEENYKNGNGNAELLRTKMVDLKLSVFDNEKRKLVSSYDREFLIDMIDNTIKNADK